MAHNILQNTFYAHTHMYCDYMNNLSQSSSITNVSEQNNDVAK